MNSSQAKPFGTHIVCSILLILSIAAESAFGQAVKIMPFGDSTTSGYDQYVSYRYDLWFDLVDAGFDVDFVGGLTTTDGSPNPNWYPEYLTTFDRDHQGLSGWRTDQLARIASTASSSHQPDIVLLWAGINDIWGMGSDGVANATNGLRNIISGIRSSVPGSTILLAQSTPYEHNNSEYMLPLNTAIATIATELDSPESPIILVDLYTGFNIESMTWDNVHQNRTGEAWVADRWFEALASILTDFDHSEINAGHSGAWYNPETSGQGLLLDVEPEDQYLFLAWFTYTDAESENPGEPHWFTAQGTYSGNSATLPISLTQGGRFDDPQPVSREVVGELTLQFDNCNEGVVAYAIDAWEVQGSFPIQRLIPGSNNVCQQHSGPGMQAVDINTGMDGGWYNPDTSGQGLLLDVHADPSGGNYLFVAWFTYGDDTASGQRWLTAQGGFQGATAVIEVSETTGGLFDDPTPVSTGPVGSMTIDFIDCSNATLSYTLGNEGPEGIIDLTRLLPKGRSLCEGIASAQSN
jgi:lysophospholipase L1-like esterase